MKSSPSFCLKVWGDFACFTRPEMKVERVSYDVMTPSAARAIFEAIMWKPAIRWIPEKIEVLKPIRWINLRRNEVGSVARPPSKAGCGIYVEEDRQQRAGLFLRDVAYRLHARLQLTDKAGEGDGIVKFAEIFTRRAEKGQCFNQPYLGCREFSAAFCLATPGTKAAARAAIDDSRDLGFMLYDIDFADEMKPMMFRAKMQNGVIHLPPPDSAEIRK